MVRLMNFINIKSALDIIKKYLIRICNETSIET